MPAENVQRLIDASGGDTQPRIILYGDKELLSFAKGYDPATLNWLKRLVDAARAEFRPAG